MKVEDLLAFVRQHKIDAEFIDHQGADGLTSESAASATGAPISQLIKVLCFVDKKGNKCFAICQGNKKIDPKKLPGLKKPRIADASELKQWFDLEPGCISPICLPIGVPIYIDNGVARLPFVIGSAGSRFIGIKISPKYITKQENSSALDISL